MMPCDVPAAHVISLAVRENRLSEPPVVTEQDYHDLLARDSMSWVCERDGVMVGSVMVDVEGRNLWALFVTPGHEGKGIGRMLHDAMLARYFEQRDTLWLTTSPFTRAADFYRAAGYTGAGPTADGKELVFTISKPA